MPKISLKGKNMPESPIRKLVPYAEGAKKRGVHVYHLNIGQPDIRTPEVALEAVKNNAIEVLAYSMTQGSDEYRTKLSAYYAKHDIRVGANDILVTTGGSEALTIIFGTILDPGDEIIVPEPFYANYNGFSNVMSATIKPITSKIEDNFALPSIEEFEKVINEKTKAILICNPVNPTGVLYSEEEIKKLLDIVKTHNLFLIADEVYREFAYDGKKHCSILASSGFDDHCIVIDSVSKRYSMCGARIGAIVSKNKEIMATAMKFAQARLSPPTFAQIASEAALETPSAYFEDVVKEYTLRRNTVVELLNNIDGVFAPMPTGAFYCIAELPIDNADDFCRWMLEKFENNNETVMMAPASGFYSTKNIGQNQVRIAYVLEVEKLKRAIEILDKGLKKYNA